MLLSSKGLLLQVAILVLDTYQTIYPAAVKKGDRIPPVFLLPSAKARSPQLTCASFNMLLT